MSQIFLSYRRDDSAGFAGRLADALEAEFGAGSVFRDVDDIRPGEDFVKAIESHLQKVGVVLVMIGPRWLEDREGRTRLDDADDFVRKEIEAALASGKPVIPLLVGGAVMPAESALPDSIAGLARHQAVVLSDGSWRGDVAKLIASLRPALPTNTVPSIHRRWWMAALAGGAAVLAVAVLSFQNWRPSPSPQTVAQPRIDISGRWQARVKYDWGDQHDEIFEFKYLGDTLHGFATYLTSRRIIEQAKLEGEWLSFATRSQEMMGSGSTQKDVTHRYTGKVSADRIQFTLESSGGYTPHAPVEFVAARMRQ